MEAGDPAVALRAGEIVSVELFDPAYFAAICSPDLDTALTRLGDFMRLVGPFGLDADVAAGETSVRYGCKHRPDVAMVLGLYQLVFPGGAGPPGDPTRVRAERELSPLQGRRATLAPSRPTSAARWSEARGRRSSSSPSMPGVPFRPATTRCGRRSRPVSGGGWPKPARIVRRSRRSPKRFWSFCPAVELE